MKVAIIPPISLLHLANIVDEYHLILPQLVISSPDYTRFYQDVKGFKILDNGEAEGMAFDQTDLHVIAHQLGCQEIIVPDAMGDLDATIARANAFAPFARPDQFQYMGVAQGHSILEIITCAQRFSDTPWISTLGLPRFMCRDDIFARLAFIQMMKRQPELWDFPGGVHALGSCTWNREVVALADEDIRGMDTSFPVVMGLDRRSIKHDAYIPRDSGYFDAAVVPGTTADRMINDNVRTFLQWGGVFRQEAPGGGVREVPS